MAESLSIVSKTVQYRDSFLLVLCTCSTLLRSLLFRMQLLHLQGVVQGSRQTAFLDTLLDLVCIADTADSPNSWTDARSGISSRSVTVDNPP